MTDRCINYSCSSGFGPRVSKHSVQSSRSHFKIPFTHSCCLFFSKQPGHSAIICKLTSLRWGSVGVLCPLSSLCCDCLFARIQTGKPWESSSIMNHVYLHPLGHNHHNWGHCPAFLPLKVFLTVFLMWCEALTCVISETFFFFYPGDYNTSIFQWPTAASLWKLLL